MTDAADGKSLADRYLIGPLNADPKSSLSKRILELVELVRRLRQLHKDLSRELRVSRYWEKHAAQPDSIRQLEREWRSALARLNKFTATYRWRREFEMPHGDSAISTMYIPITRSTRKVNEASVLALLTQFHDLADRILRCNECDKWFFAATSWQYYCDRACRQKHAARSTEFKAKKRDYMRLDYRPLVKERERKAKQRRIKELEQKVATLKGKRHGGL